MREYIRVTSGPHEGIIYPILTKEEVEKTNNPYHDGLYYVDIKYYYGDDYRGPKDVAFIGKDFAEIGKEFAKIYHNLKEL